MLGLLTPLLFVYVAVVITAISVVSYPVIAAGGNLSDSIITIIKKLLPNDEYILFEGVRRASDLLAPDYRASIEETKENYPDLSNNLLKSTYEVIILRDIIVLGAIFSVFLGLTLFATLLQDYYTTNKINSNAIHNIESEAVVNPTLEDSVYIVTPTPNNFKLPEPRLVRTSTPTVTPTSTPTSSPTPTSTSTPTSTPTPTPTITLTPTRRVIFGQSLSSAEPSILTPTVFSNQRGSNGLPAIVILDFVMPVDNSNSNLLLVNFGYTISMANWRLYFNQQLVCTFGEYIFWPDTVLMLDMSKNLDERTIDDQLILNCEKISKDVFLGSVTIRLQDHTGTEIDRYVYEKRQ